MAIFQILVRLLDGKTRCLRITYPCISGDSLRSHLHRETRIPPQFLRLVSGSREIRDETLLSAAEDGSFPSCTLLLRLPGGKGGFGSLLRGAATKAGQKKTSNFDACRDMSGRRLRHVNAEKKLEEWKAGAEVRRLEKVAEQFLKKKAKEVKKRPNGDVERYIQKYKEESERCMEEVEEAVKQSFLLYEKSKRKVLPSSGPASKRVKLWLGKEKVDDSDDSEDSDDEDDAAEKKSVVIDNVNHWDGEGSSGTASGRQSDGELSGEGSEKSILEDENGSFVQTGILEVGCSSRENDDALDSDGSVEPEVIIQHDNATENSVDSCMEQPSEINRLVVNVGDIGSNDMAKNQQHDHNQNITPMEQFPSSMDVDLVEPAAEPPKPVNTESCVVPLAVNSQHLDRVDQQIDTSNSGMVGTACEGTVVASKEGPLNFDEFNTSAELESLGMERLKSELQERGLKCGGTLQERAARLFLVKTTPLDKLPKKLFAKPGAK